MVLQVICYTGTWQMNLLLPMDPTMLPEQRCTWYTSTSKRAQMNLHWSDGPQSRFIMNRYLEYCYTKLGRWTLLWYQWTPQRIKNRCLEYCYTKLGRWTFFGQMTPPVLRAEMTCIAVHKMWQMNLLWLNTMANGLKGSSTFKHFWDPPLHFQHPWQIFF